MLLNADVQLEFNMDICGCLVYLITFTLSDYVHVDLHVWIHRNSLGSCWESNGNMMGVAW